MVEQSNNTDDIEYKEIELFHTQPEEHVTTITDISPYNDIDLDKYFTGYSFEICEDTLNSFYGGGFVYREGVDVFNKEVSNTKKELVKSRLEWLSTFEYTPEEIKKEVGIFLKQFIDKENSLNSFSSWRDIIDKWIVFIRDKDGVVQRLREDERFKEDIKYFKDKNKEIVHNNENGGLRVG
jgi:hypothetical protein